jgi:hypothetical protein
MGSEGAESVFLFLAQVCWEQWGDSRYRVFLLARVGPQWKQAVREMLQRLELAAPRDEIKRVIYFDDNLYDDHYYNRQLLRHSLPRQRLQFFAHEWEEGGFRETPMPPSLHLLVALLHRYPVPHLTPLPAAAFRDYCARLTQTMTPIAAEGVPFLLIYPIAVRSSRHVGASPKSDGSYRASFLCYVHTTTEAYQSRLWGSHRYLRLVSASDTPAFERLCGDLALGKRAKLVDGEGREVKYRTNEDTMNLCVPASRCLESFMGE